MRLTYCIYLLILYQVSLAQTINSGDHHFPMPVDTFWMNLEELCGSAFEGKVEYAPEGDTVFSDQKIQMHVSKCHENKIYIHLHVGEDRSRTWVITRSEGRLLLKHYHRHKDGSEDGQSQYGGWTSNCGMSNIQVFPADQFTVSIIPAASANVWWIELFPGQSLSYNLRRLNTDRYFSLKFDLSHTIVAPPNAWGWDE